MKKAAYDYCERVAKECRQQTGEWIYGRLVEAAKRAAESWKDFPDDIPDAVDTEFDYFMSEWMEKSGITLVVEKEGGRGQWRKASTTASRRPVNSLRKWRLTASARRKWTFAERKTFLDTAPNRS